MTLIKTSFWTSFSVLIRAISVFIVSKVIAVYIGPVGLAIIEQFQNFIQIIRTFSGTLMQQGIVKYVSEYRHDDNFKSHILSSALIISILFSLIFGLLLLYFSPQVSLILFQTFEYRNILQILAASFILFSFNSICLSLLNGELEIKKYALSNIANSVFILFVTIYLVINFGLYGGLLALILNQSVTLFFTLFLMIKCKWFKIQLFLRGIDFRSVSKLMTYALIMVIITLITPISQLIVRNYVAHVFSWQEAGYWQGIMKLSNNYAIIIDSILGIYYLPKFSEIQSLQTLKNEIINGYKFILPIATIAAIIIFFMKKIIIVVLYSREFIPMSSLFKYQLIGDVARTGIWLLSYTMIAKTMVKTLFVAEVSFLLYYIIFTMVFVHYFGLIGTTISFALSYFLYWFSMLFFMWKHFKRESLVI